MYRYDTFIVTILVTIAHTIITENETMNKPEVSQKWCQCGCGLPVTRRGRAVYFSDVHRMRDFRVRQKAHKWAFYQMTKRYSGDLSKYPELYQEYYDWFSVQMRMKHSDEIRQYTSMYYQIPDEDLPF